VPRKGYTTSNGDRETSMNLKNAALRVAVLALRQICQIALVRRRPRALAGVAMPVAQQQCLELLARLEPCTHLSMSRLFEGVGIKLYDGVPGTGSRVL
jgi:hypothetical protein